jgi:hypothetical protein
MRYGAKAAVIDALRRSGRQSSMNSSPGPYGSYGSYISRKPRHYDEYAACRRRYGFPELRAPGSPSDYPKAVTRLGFCRPRFRSLVSSSNLHCSCASEDSVYARLRTERFSRACILGELVTPPDNLLDR